MPKGNVGSFTAANTVCSRLARRGGQEGGKSTYGLSHTGHIEKGKLHPKGGWHFLEITSKSGHLVLGKKVALTQLLVEMPQLGWSPQKPLS